MILFSLLFLLDPSTWIVVDLFFLVAKAHDLKEKSSGNDAANGRLTSETSLDIEVSLKFFHT